MLVEAVALEDNVDALEDKANSLKDETEVLEDGADSLEVDVLEDEAEKRTVGILLFTSVWFRRDGGGVGRSMLSELYTAAAPADSSSNLTCLCLITQDSSSSRHLLLVVLALKRADCWLLLFSFAFADITNCSHVLSNQL